MMWARVVVPLLIVLIMAIIVLALVLHQRQKSMDLDRKERLASEKRWLGDCSFSNPNTGAKCNREDFHLENHYHVLEDGSLTGWP